MDQDVPEVLDHGEEVEPIQEMYMESGQEVYAETGQEDYGGQDEEFPGEGAWELEQEFECFDGGRRYFSILPVLTGRWCLGETVSL